MEFDFIDGGFEASEGFGGVGRLVKILSSSCDGMKALAPYEAFWHEQWRTILSAA
jgi:hypothetical protein